MIDMFAPPTKDELDSVKSDPMFAPPSAQEMAMFAPPTRGEATSAGAPQTTPGQVPGIVASNLWNGVKSTAGKVAQQAKDIYNNPVGELKNLPSAALAGAEEAESTAGDMVNQFVPLHKLNTGMTAVGSWAAAHMPGVPEKFKNMSIDDWYQYTEAQQALQSQQNQKDHPFASMVGNMAPAGAALATGNPELIGATTVAQASQGAQAAQQGGGNGWDQVAGAATPIVATGIGIGAGKALAPAGKALQQTGEALNKADPLITAGTAYHAFNQVASGNPMGAVHAVGARVAYGIAKPFISKGAGTLGDILQKTPEQLGPYASILQNAQNESDDKLAVTNYLLQQRDPKYHELIQNLTGDQGSD